jgi:hypothetical protein
MANARIVRLDCRCQCTSRRRFRIVRRRIHTTISVRDRTKSAHVISQRIDRNNRSKWNYWYGPYSQWAFFVHLSALVLLITVICCPEWAYGKYETYFIFFEIGLFKQCYLSSIYKKDISNDLCTLSDAQTNKGDARCLLTCLFQLR